MKELNPDIFLCAAEIVLDPEFRFGCCRAITKATEEFYRTSDLGIYIPYREYFYSLFDINQYYDEYAENWGGYNAHVGARWRGDVDQDHIEARVMALLICYWELKGI